MEDNRMHVIKSTLMGVHNF